MPTFASQRSISQCLTADPGQHTALQRTLALVNVSSPQHDAAHEAKKLVDAGYKALMNKFSESTPELRMERLKGRRTCWGAQWSRHHLECSWQVVVVEQVELGPWGGHRGQGAV